MPKHTSKLLEDLIPDSYLRAIGEANQQGLLGMVLLLDEPTLKTVMSGECSLLDLQGQGVIVLVPANKIVEIYD